VLDVRNTKKRTKYSNVKVIIDGIKIDSKKEGAHYYKLKDQLAAGKISNLTLQPKFDIAQSVILDGTKRRIRYYIADFSYIDSAGKLVVEDVKGFKTEMYKLKRHLVKEIHGIEVVEI
jgi:hypothetical protein